MKKIYTNKAMNRQRGTSPSFRTILLVSCVLLTMTAVKVIYNPDKGMEDVEAMAQMALQTEETEEIQNPNHRSQNQG